MLTCIIPTVAENAVAEDDAIRLLGALEIMNGDGNGNLNLDGNVTRAEFSKMLVSASSYKENISSNSISTGFSDVPASHWASPYIRVASTNKWIYGYSDGSFAPQSNIKLEEAATMLIRVLGYTATDVTGVYPNGQLALYESLELDTGVTAKKGDIVTRRDCLQLFVNLLNAKTKSGQVYAQTLGYSLGSDGKIDIYKTVSEKTKGPFVLEGDITDIVKDAEKYTVYRKNKSADISELQKYDVIYYSDTLKTLWAYSDSVTGTYDSSIVSGTLPTSVTVGGKNYSFENTEAAKSMSVYGKYSPDDAVTLLLGRDGSIVRVLDASEYHIKDTDKYLETVANTLTGPYIFNGDLTEYDFLTGDTKIMYESSEINLDGLNKYDVLYHSPISNTVWVYRDAITGKYTSANPSVTSPSSVTVGSKVYQIEDSDAAFALSFMGEFELDDMITLLLGKDGGIAAVVSVDEYISIDDDNYLELIESTLEGPFIVTSSYSALSLPTDVSVTRNNKSASIDNIKKYDVVYYSKAAKAVIVYGKTVSGTYTAATPNADNPTGITVAGNTYTLANSNVAISVSNIGKYPTGTLVTLLLGKNDEVAFVLPMSEYAKDVYGIVLGSTTKLYSDETGKTYSAKTLKIATTSGDTLSIQSTASFTEGDIVKVSFSENTEISKVKSKSLSGEVGELSIGNMPVSSDVNIIETDLHGNDPSPLFFSRLTGAKLDEDDVRFYVTDDEGKITDLILSDFSGDGYSYGIMLTAEPAAGFVSDDEDFDYSQTVNYVYEFQVGTQKNTINTPNCYIEETGPCVLKYSSGKLEEMVMLNQLKSPSVITSFGIVNNNELHLYSDDLIVYTPSKSQKGDVKYATIKLNELLENIEDYKIQAFNDYKAVDGGRIRLIIATPK